MIKEQNLVLPIHILLISRILEFFLNSCLEIARIKTITFAKNKTPEIRIMQILKNKPTTKDWLRGAEAIAL